MLNDLLVSTLAHYRCHKTSANVVEINFNGPMLVSSVGPFGCMTGWSASSVVGWLLRLSIHPCILITNVGHAVRFWRHYQRSNHVGRSIYLLHIRHLTVSTTHGLGLATHSRITRAE